MVDGEHTVDAKKGGDPDASALPAGLLPINIIQHFDRLDLNAGIVVACPAKGWQMHLDYSGAFGASTIQHELSGGLTYEFGGSHIPVPGNTCQ